MDAATVLEEYLSDITNLPTDMAYILDEIHGKEEQLREVQKRIYQKDAMIQKFVRTHGSLSENPREAQINPRVRSDFQEAIALQEDKCNLANTGLYIISRYVKKLEDEIKTLEHEGLIPPLQYYDESPTPDPIIPPRKKREERRGTMSRTQTPTTPLGTIKVETVAESGSFGPGTPARTHNGANGQRPIRRQKGDEEDEQGEKYCICQQKSQGDMVGCDNDDCKYEWFHWKCVGLTEAPNGTWICPPCRKAKGLL